MKSPSKIWYWKAIQILGVQKVVQIKATAGTRIIVTKCHLIHDIEHYALYMCDTGQ